MYGAIIGDIVGSVYEHNNIKTKDFPFVSDRCRFTDDTVMTVAVASALLRCNNKQSEFSKTVVEEMQRYGQRFPHAGYGGSFRRWIWAEDPQPYNSYGNGSAMRVSPCGLIARSLNEATALAETSARVTHDHPEGIKGAQAVAAAIYLAKHGEDKERIRTHIENTYYSLPKSLDLIRPEYYFDVSCQGSVPQAILAFLESENYEDAIRNAISIGGDSDTIAAIAGSIAWSYYRAQAGEDDPVVESEGMFWPQSCQRLVAEAKINDILPDDFVELIRTFDKMAWPRNENRATPRSVGESGRKSGPNGKAVVAGVAAAALVLGVVVHQNWKQDEPDERSESETVAQQNRQQFLTFLNTNISEMPVGLTGKFYVGIDPPVANAEIYFESSNPSILSVDEYGTYEALGAGNVQVTATLGDAETIQLIEIYYPVEDIILSAPLTLPEDLILPGGYYTFQPPLEDTVPKFSSSDPSVFEVDRNGEITAKQAGEAELTITYHNISRTFPVTVYSTEIEIVKNTVPSGRITATYGPPAPRNRDGSKIRSTRPAGETMPPIDVLP